MFKKLKYPHLKIIKKNADFIFNILFPIECLGCSKENYWLCGECFSRLQYRDESYCFSCGKNTRYSKTCADCLNKTKLNGLWAAGKYNNKILERLIKTLKYNFSKDISPIIGNYLSLYFKNLVKNFKNKNKNLIIETLEFFDNTLVIPVPLHPKRLRWRGFNQSLEIARTFSNNLNMELNFEDLVKIKHTKPQAKTKKEKRKDNIKNSFSWRGKNLSNRNIILIDDISTSGSTLNECAMVLKKNGAGEIWGLVAAVGR